AERIPPSMEEELSRQTLASADTFVFKPSKVDPARREAVNRDFASLRAVASVPGGTRLEFRDGEFLGPNALTFPGGVIVVTDKLVEIMDDDQVVAVLAHELGHVHHRHGTRHLLNNSMHALIAMAVFGDVSAVAGTAATVPTVLVNTAYSRDFEREADGYAFELLRRSGRSPLDFARALESLRAEIARLGGPHIKAGYFSTHPDFGERIEAAKRAAAQ
ncbi:MAG: M48 family metallopeptidase, partial [Usitatibacter sp.]